MSGLYICANCRRKLSQRVDKLAKSQWHSRASFITLTPGSASPGDKPSATSTDGSTHQQKAKTIWKAPPAPQRRREGKDPNLESLFLDLGKPVAGRYSKGLQPSIPQEEPPQAPSVKRVDLSEATGKATRLEELLDDPKHTTLEAWQFFLENFQGENDLRVSKLPFQELGKLLRGSPFKKLLKAVVKAWCHQGASATALPRPSQLVATYQEQKIMRPEHWSDAMWLVLVQAVRGCDGTPEVSTAQHKEALLKELIALWKAFFAAYAKPKSNEPADSTASPNGWSGLPDVRGWSKLSSGSNFSREFGERSNHLAARYGTAAIIKPELQAAAFLTFNMLVQPDRPRGTDVTESDSAPFVHFIAHLLPGVRTEPLLSHIQDQFQLAQLPKERIDELLAQCKAFESRAMVIIALSNEKTLSGAEDASDAAPSGSLDQLESFFIKRLNRAIETQSTRSVDTLWQDAQQAFARMQDGLPKTAIPVKVYDTFLRVYMTLKEPNKAVNVWNAMVASGVQPTVATWTAMMAGTSKARDIVTLEQMWQRMLASGIRPDVYTWSVRIHGLVSCGHHMRGLQVLDEMGRAYADAVRQRQSKRKGNTKVPEDPPDAAKPNIELVNSVVTALMRTRKQDFIPKVLTWARAFNVQPDAVTFNILIRASLQNNNVQEAMRLLKQMETMSVQPDVATFTIILNHTFRASTLSSMPQHQQDEAVIAVLQELQARGLQENAWVYSTLIDGLLKHHDNLPAARAVLQYMAYRKITPVPHIYTTLITHYFSQTPPDVPAVDALWSHIEATGGTTDLIFFDRIVEGYAHAGEVGKMMVFLARMGREGKSPSWTTLTTVVRALADVGDVARIRNVVDDVRNEKRSLNNNRIRHSTPERAFWELVNGLGIGYEDR